MSLAEQYEVFVFDGDGVLYVDDTPLPGALEAVRRLKAMGKTLRFVTNDPCPSRRAMEEKLAKMGFPFTSDQIFPVGRAVAAYLQEEGIQNAYVLGSRGLREELQRAGVACLTGQPVEAVVLGYDHSVTVADYQQAGQLINEGAVFVAANRDVSFPTSRGRLPASGSMVRALEMATGIPAQLVGKPSTWIFRFALKGVSPEGAVMIGDTPDSDIIGAHRFGIAGVLVGDGKQPACLPGDYRCPEAVIATLPDLFSPDVTPRTWQDPGYPWPDRVVPAVAAVVIGPADEVLLIKRTDNGLWALPTGHLERGESTEQGTLREVGEETGLTVAIQALAGVYSDPRSMTLVTATGDAVQYVTTCYRCRVIGGRLRPAPAEVLEARYFPVTRLPEPMVTAHRIWIREAIEKT